MKYTSGIWNMYVFNWLTCIHITQILEINVLIYFIIWCRPMYIWGFRARQHLRSLAPVIIDEWWWQWWPNDIRGPWGPKASRHLSYRWGKTPKKPHPRNLSRPESKPGALLDRRACYRLPHSGGLYNLKIIKNLNIRY